MGYGGRKSPRGYASAAVRRIFLQLTKSGLYANRISVIDGGYREDPEFELWSVPQGAEQPKPAPTVDREDIETPAPVRSTSRPTRPRRP